VSSRTQARAQPCQRGDARIRLEHAKAFLDAAELIGAEEDDVATPGVASALAVLAGIAASDAACCAVLHQRSRSQNHRDAVGLLAQLAPTGPTMARDLERLLGVKDDAHYGMLHVSSQRATAALRQAKRLVSAAATYVE
jgi:hypothetical protein